MILEGLVTTLDAADALNIAPMGPSVEPDFRRFLLKPFRTSNTYRNLQFRGEGVLHVTDDVLLMARSTLGRVTDASTRPAERVRGRVLLDCCRYYEFRVTSADETGERTVFQAEVVNEGRQRDFFGFNRAKHAVLETAILASRIDFLELDGLSQTLETHRVVVEKTGNSREAEAFALLRNHIGQVARSRGFEIGDSGS